MDLVQQTMTWSEMDEQQRAAFVAAFGQVDFGRMVWEGFVNDERCGEEGEEGVTIGLPWDAYAEIDADGRLKLVGMTGPSGRGPTKETILPEDVKVAVHAWTR